MLAGSRLHGLDALDRVDLVRAVLAEGLLEAVEHRTQPAPREAHQVQVDRRRREEDEREHPVVDEHQRERGDQRRKRRQALDALLNHERPHLAHALKPALDIARTPRLEVAHRELEQLPGEEVERLSVDHDGGLAQDVALDEGCAGDRGEYRPHAAEQEVEQAVVRLDEDIVEDDLREDRQHHLERRRKQGQEGCPDERSFEGPEEIPDPAHVLLAEGRLLEALSIGEQRCVARPLLLELRPVHLDEAATGVREANVLLVDPVEDDPVVALEVAHSR